MAYGSGKPFRRYVLWYALVFAAVTAVWGGVLGVVLPNQVQSIEFAKWFTGADADVDLTALNNLKAAVDAGTAVATGEQRRLLDLLGDFDSARAQALSLVTSLAVAATMIVQPVVGVLSDRTRSRFGRRAPWILFGALVGTCFLVGVRFAPTIAVLALLWTCTQTVLTMVSGPLQTTVADRIPQERVGAVSGIGSLGNFGGGVLGEWEQASSSRSSAWTSCTRSRPCCWSRSRGSSSWHVTGHRPIWWWHHIDGARSSAGSSCRCATVTSGGCGSRGFC